MQRGGDSGVWEEVGVLPGVPELPTAVITCLETVVPTVLQMKTLTQDRESWGLCFRISSLTL